MFLHIGEDVVVPAEDVIMILDLRTAGTAEATREFLEISRDEGFLVEIGQGEHKALVLTSERGYLTPISSLTLAGRSKASLVG
ncbi:MAG: extracellular matrix regulatory protein [Bacillota bacterium]|jgi:hypothetical protein|nr:extracellular matrix regulatory protein [Bacillota bacterium]